MPRSWPGTRNARLTLRGGSISTFKNQKRLPQENPQACPHVRACMIDLARIPRTRHLVWASLMPVAGVGGLNLGFLVAARNLASGFLLWQNVVFDCIALPDHYWHSVHLR